MADGSSRVVDKDLGWAALKAQAKAFAGQHSVQVGVEDGPEVAIAAAHEFGTARLPQRSFLRASFDKHRQGYERLLERLASSMYTPKLQLARSLGAIGAQMQADTRKYIASGQVGPPDSPETVARKGSSTVLVETGELVKAITYEVEVSGTTYGPGGAK